MVRKSCLLITDAASSLESKSSAIKKGLHTSGLPKHSKSFQVSEVIRSICQFAERGGVFTDATFDFAKAVVPALTRLCVLGDDSLSELSLSLLCYSGSLSAVESLDQAFLNLMESVSSQSIAEKYVKVVFVRYCLTYCLNKKATESFLDQWVLSVKALGSRSSSLSLVVKALTARTFLARGSLWTLIVQCVFLERLVKGLVAANSSSGDLSPVIIDLFFGLQSLASELNISVSHLEKYKPLSCVCEQKGECNYCVTHSLLDIRPELRAIPLDVVITATKLSSSSVVAGAEESIFETCWAHMLDCFASGVRVDAVNVKEKSAKRGKPAGRIHPTPCTNSVCDGGTDSSTNWLSHMSTLKSEVEQPQRKASLLRLASNFVDACALQSLGIVPRLTGLASTLSCYVAIYLSRACQQGNGTYVHLKEPLRRICACYETLSLCGGTTAHVNDDANNSCFPWASKEDLSIFARFLLRLVADTMVTDSSMLDCVLDTICASGAAVHHGLRGSDFLKEFLQTAKRILMSNSGIDTRSKAMEMVCISLTFVISECNSELDTALTLERREVCIAVELFAKHWNPCSTYLQRSAHFRALAVVLAQKFILASPLVSVLLIPSSTECQEIVAVAYDNFVNVAQAFVRTVADQKDGSTLLSSVIKGCIDVMCKSFMISSKRCAKEDDASSVSLTDWSQLLQVVSENLPHTRECFDEVYIGVLELCDRYISWISTIQKADTMPRANGPSANPLAMAEPLALTALSLLTAACRMKFFVSEISADPSGILRRADSLATTVLSRGSPRLIRALMKCVAEALSQHQVSSLTQLWVNLLRNLSSSLTSPQSPPTAGLGIDGSPQSRKGTSPRLVTIVVAALEANAPSSVAPSVRDEVNSCLTVALERSLHSISQYELAHQGSKGLVFSWLTSLTRNPSFCRPAFEHPVFRQTVHDLAVSNISGLACCVSRILLAHSTAELRLLSDKSSSSKGRGNSVSKVSPASVSRVSPTSVSRVSPRRAVASPELFLAGPDGGVVCRPLGFAGKYLLSSLCDKSWGSVEQRVVVATALAAMAVHGLLAYDQLIGSLVGELVAGTVLFESDDTLVLAALLRMLTSNKNSPTFSDDTCFQALIHASEICRSRWTDAIRDTSECTASSVDAFRLLLQVASPDVDWTDVLVHSVVSVLKQSSGQTGAPAQLTNRIDLVILIAFAGFSGTADSLVEKLQSGGILGNDDDEEDPIAVVDTTEYSLKWTLDKLRSHRDCPCPYCVLFAEDESQFSQGKTAPNDRTAPNFRTTLKSALPQLAQPVETDTKPTGRAKLASDRAKRKRAKQSEESEDGSDGSDEERKSYVTRTGRVNRRDYGTRAG